MVLLGPALGAKRFVLAYARGIRPCETEGHDYPISIVRTRIWPFVLALLSLPTVTWAGPDIANSTRPGSNLSTQAGERARDALSSLVLDDPLLEPPARSAKVLSNWRDAVRTVRARAPSLRFAAARTLQSNALVEQALVGLRPTVVGTGRVSKQLLEGSNGNPFANGTNTVVIGSLSLRQPLIAPQRWFDHKTAKERLAASRLDEVDAKRQALAVAADSVINVVTAERLAEVNRVALRSALTTLHLTRRRAALGAASALDVLRSERQVVNVKGQVVDADETLAMARDALGAALGDSDPWGVSPDLRMQRLIRDAGGQCKLVETPSARADVQAAQQRVKVARRDARSAQYQRYPSLDVSTDLNYTTAAFTGNGRKIQWNIGAVLSVPIYDAGSANAQSYIAQSALEVERETLAQARRNATVEVRQSLRAVQVAKQNQKVSLESRRLARETARLARISFLNGNGTSFEMIDAEQQRQQSELDLAVKEFQLVRANVTALLAQADCQI